MHTLKTLFFVALAVLTMQKSVAQSLFTSAKLEEIYRLLPADFRNSINQSSSFSSKCKIAGDTLLIKINFNNEKQISHLGIDLFSNEMKLVFSDSELSFIERYFLDLILRNDIGYSRKKNQEDKIQFEINGKSLSESDFGRINSVIPILNSNFAFNLKQEGLFNKAELKSEKGNLTLVYPANNTVVSGLDKKEYGEQIMASLKSFKNPNDFKMEIPKIESLIHYKLGIKTNKGKNYLNEKINSNKYFTVENNIVRPLFSKQFQEESFCNLFLIPGFEKNNQIDLDITHKIYGDEKHQYRVNLNDFLIHFSKDFEFYFGLEECSGKSVSGTLIMFNKSLNFINLLYVTTENNGIFGKNPVVNSKFYTNIPTDNIKNMFSEYDDSKNGRKKYDTKIYE
jgi:hypothetical protein